MHRYSAFGYCIESALELAELDPAATVNAPLWRVEIDPAHRSFEDAALIGWDTVYGDVRVRAFASATGYQIVFDDTGTFDVRPRDRRISWRPGARATDAAMRSDFLGRVIGMAAHADGHLALHASAVSIGGRAIAFMGPKHAGKSTLALALVRHGARLLTDDTLVVRLADGMAIAAPGVQRVRLWMDSARALAAPVSNDVSAKPTIDRLTPSELETAAVPLSACYVLDPAPTAVPEPIHRVRLSAVEATLAGVRFSKLGPLAGGAVGEAVLDRAARLAGTVPIYAAAVQRALTNLDDAARTLIAAHDAGDVVSGITRH